MVNHKNSVLKKTMLSLPQRTGSRCWRALGGGIWGGLTSGALLTDGMAKPWKERFACWKRVAKGEKEDYVKERVFATRVSLRAPRDAGIGDAWLHM
jgi:hypothetical protein